MFFLEILLKFLIIQFIKNLKKALIRTSSCDKAGDQNIFAEIVKSGRNEIDIFSAQ